MLETTKQCTKCKIIKDLSEFYKWKAIKDGYRNHCKHCMFIASKKYRDENKETIAKNKKEYEKNNKDKSKINQKRYRDKNKDIITKKRIDNKENINLKNREYYKNHKVEIKEYRENNKYKISISKKKYIVNNKDKISKQRKEYRKKNIEKIKDYARYYGQSLNGKISQTNSRNKRRYLIKLSSDGTIPNKVQYPLTVELKELLEIQDYKCYICKSDITKKKHLDHHIPLSKGGTHSINNVVWLCPLCNLTKHSKMPDTLLII